MVYVLIDLNRVLILLMMIMNLILDNNNDENRFPYLIFLIINTNLLSLVNHVFDFQIDINQIS